MNQLKTDQSPRQAFVRGFWIGLTAPLRLYSRRLSSEELEKIEPIALPERPRGSVADDWAAVGDDLRDSFEQIKRSRA